MTPRNFDHQGKREDQVAASELIAGLCFGLLIVLAVGSCFMGWAK